MDDAVQCTFLKYIVPSMHIALEKQYRLVSCWDGLDYENRFSDRYLASSFLLITQNKAMQYATSFEEKPHSSSAHLACCNCSDQASGMFHEAVVPCYSLAQYRCPSAGVVYSRGAVQTLSRRYQSTVSSQSAYRHSDTSSRCLERSPPKRRRKAAS